MIDARTSPRCRMPVGLSGKAKVLSGSTLIVVADGGSARFLSRGAPGENLVERADLQMRAVPAALEQDCPPRVLDRTGSGRHAIEDDQTECEAAAYAFLVEVAGRACEVLGRGGFSQLAVCAPTATLGVLRKVLTHRSREKLVLSVGTDICRKSVAEIDIRMRELLV